MRSHPSPDDDGDTRPASVWPSTLRPADALSSTFAASRFDPLAEERARVEAHAAVAFDVCHPGLALRAVVGVQLVLAVAGLVALGDGWWRTAGAVAFAGLAGSLLWLLPVCALKQALRRMSPASRAAAALALGAAAALLAQAPLWWLAEVQPGLVQMLGIGLAGAGLAGLLWAWLDLRARIWAPVDARVRLAELQSRIRPHFLFNALNTALALLRAEPRRAEAVLQNLGDLFRAALADAGASISLDEELTLARAYLAIEQERFGRRLRLEWDVATGVGRARVPPLMLQPLVENAVRHGVEPSAGGARVSVKAFVRRGQAVVQVSNGLPDEPGLPGHGMALHNVRERLRLLHDVGATFEAWREDGQHHARIVIPL